ncbi:MULTISPECIES: hypothetical protein [Methylobacterium]|uniref:hypothetical protein n=1 Tax=Methylobacterium TaxID=407 RepID=UPI0013EBB299|nr:hypothetical protein [Methylobacterium sp. DB0501]NGM34799.1 hypothetical protein [Methylobacterium sp. DB0501]
MGLANPWRRTRGRRLPSREQVLLLLTGAAIAAVGVALAGGDLLGNWLAGSWLG